MRIGSLFSGYGGLDLAVEQVTGATPAWFVEHEAAPSRILANHWPDVPNHGDVTTVDWSQVEPVDVITGGSPCQDLSHAGKRAGMTEGTRSNLWVAMREAIAALRPSMVVWENVRGAYSAAADSEMEQCPRCVGGPRHGEPVLRALGRVLGDLSDLGYVGGWHGLRAADVGAPHGRFRVFVVAWPATDADRAVSGERWIAAPRQAQGRWSWANVGRRGGALDPQDLTLLPTPAVNDMGAGKTVEAWDGWTARMQAAHGNGNGHGASLHIEALRMLPTPRARDHIPESYDAGMRRQAPQLGTLAVAGVKGDIAWGDYAPAIARWEHVLGRPAPDPTEPTGRDGAHRLSPRFVEWMMGLPDGWVTGVPGVTRNHALKALGNGVVPQQAAAALTYLLDVASVEEVSA